MPDEQAERRSLGRTGLQVTSVCIGTSPLANMSNLYGYDVETDQALATIRAVFESPIGFLDTSNGYGVDGIAERRVGQAIREAGGLPDGFVLATKVDPDPETGNFSGDRVRASVEESLDRLGLDKFDLLYLHDPERITFEQGMADGGPVEALAALREAGVAAHLGVAGGPVDVLRQYVETDVFDVVLSHNRYTLLDRSAEALFADARDRGLGVVNAAPYGGGMLARGPDAQPKYAYGADKGSAVRDAALAMQAVCLEYSVPLAAAALQFSLRSPIIHSTVVGVSSPERVAQTVEYANLSIDDALWQRLAELTPPADQWIG